MARCEDFPCCGHEPGRCPDRDEAGRQLNMICVCGAKVPLSSRFSLCRSCLMAPDEEGRSAIDPDDFEEYNRNEAADYQDE